MLIPIPMSVSENIDRKTIPVANYALIAINVFAFFVCRYDSWWVGPGTGFLSLLTYGFVHAGWTHVLFNMWSLWVFGNAVNRRLGNSYYVMIYLGSILAIGLLARMFSGGFLVGSSGGVFAVMGVALMLLPSARVELHYLAFFPLTLVIGLFKRPEYPLFWFVRWGTGHCSMLLLLIAFAAMELFGLLWWGFSFGLNWTNAAHLLGIICGIGAVLLLPKRVSMGSRAGVSA